MAATVAFSFLVSQDGMGRDSWYDSLLTYPVHIMTQYVCIAYFKTPRFLHWSLTFTDSNVGISKESLQY